MKIKKWKVLLATLTAVFAFSTVGNAFAASLTGKTSFTPTEQVTAVAEQTSGIDPATLPVQTIDGKTVRMEMQFGASLRLSEEDSDRGMRFSTYVKTEDYDAIIDAGGSFGTIIVPKDGLAENQEITHEIGVADETYLDIPATNVTKDATTGLTRFNGVISKIKIANYDREFCARSYVKVGDEYVYSAYDENAHCRKVCNVALDAVADGTEDKGDSLKAYIGGTDISAVKTFTLPEYGTIGYLDGTARDLPSPSKDGKQFSGWIDSTTGSKITTLQDARIAWNLTAEWADVLVDFNDADSLSHVKYSGFTTVPPEYLASFQGATGVVKAHTSDKYSMYGQSKLQINTEKTEDELKALLSAGDFAYVNVRVYIPGAENATYTIGSHNYRFATVNANEWVDIQITKKVMEASNSYWMNFGANTARGIDRFAINHKKDGGTAGTDYLFYVYLPYENGVQDEKIGVDVYVDSITCVKKSQGSMPKGVLENFDTAESASRFSIQNASATVAGTQPSWQDSYNGREGVLKVTTASGYYLYANFTRTAAQLEALGITKIKINYCTSATSPDCLRTYVLNVDSSHNTPPSTTWTTDTLTIEQLKAYQRFSGSISSLGAGEAGNWLYRLTGSITLYIDSIEYEAPERVIMPDGVLENFDTEESATRFSVQTDATTTSTKNTVSWEASHSDGTTEKNGVLKVSLKGDSANTYLYGNFTRTVAELKALGITKVSITYCVADGGDHFRWTESGESSHWPLDNKDTWTTAEITIGTLESFIRFKTNGFEETMGSDSNVTSNWLLRFIAGGIYNTLYIDEITYS